MAKQGIKTVKLTDVEHGILLALLDRVIDNLNYDDSLELYVFDELITFDSLNAMDLLDACRRIKKEKSS